jgi:hypothetical protein
MNDQRLFLDRGEPLSLCPSCSDVWIDGAMVATVDCYRENLWTQGWREPV